MSPLVLVLLFSQMARPEDSIARMQTTPSFTQHVPLEAKDDASNPAISGNTCYAIRSYIFRREDGNAPVLVGTATCTPADMVHPRRVKRAPMVRLVPAN